MPHPCNRRRNPWSTAALVAACLTTGVPADAAPNVAPTVLADAAWALGGEAHFEEHLGRHALALRTGRAVARDVALENGTIDFAIALSGRRSFAYVDFRIGADDDHEEIYLRAHKSRLPDALQYAPVFHGESEWQLYHDPGATAPVEIPAGRWLPARLVIAGSRAAFYLGDLSQPALVVTRLARGGATKGPIGFHGFATRDVPAGETAVWISGVSVSTAPPTQDLAALAPAEAPAPAGSLLRLEASAPFEAGGTLLREPPSPFVEACTLTADAAGRFEPYRELARPKRDRAMGIWLRLPFRALTAGVRTVQVGFSDAITVFLDGRPIAASDASYSYDAPRQDGLMTLSQLAVFLPLSAGEHELLFGLVDDFGGMGLVARFDDRVGLDLGGGQ